MRLAGFKNKPKKYIAFFTVVPVLLLTGLIRVNCPACDGTGVIGSNPGMENVRVYYIESKPVETWRDGCGLFLLYHYDVKMELQNQGKTPATGYVKMILVDYAKGQPVSHIYYVVDVPASTVSEYVFNLWFRVSADVEVRTEVKATVVTGEIPCDICEGTGRIPLNIVPMANDLEERYKEMIRVDTPWMPPITRPWVE
jgi:hypothetical protein